MPKNLASRCCAVAFAVLALTTAANAEAWRVVQSTGQVWFGSGSAQRASLGKVDLLADGALVTTGGAGRVLLVRGTQTMAVGPNTVVTLPKGPASGFTTVLQRSGMIEFDVDTRQVQHFAVETPYLAAVVKGTHFTVAVSATGATVSVTRGLVGVTDLATGQTADVPAGQSAAANGAKLTVAGIGKLPQVVAGRPRASLVAPLSTVEVRALNTGNAGLALGSTAVRANPKGKGIGVGLGGGNAGGNGNGKGDVNAAIAIVNADDDSADKDKSADKDDSGDGGGSGKDKDKDK